MAKQHQGYEDWRWWSSRADGRAAAKKEFEKLPVGIQGEFLGIMSRWLSQTHARHEYDSLGRGLHELRVREGNNHFRVLFAIEGRLCIALSAFYKNQQQLPKKEGETARKRMRSGTSVPFDQG
ncbi:hypothetical protein MLP_49450 [Microlunatus phosphovorus NM-1]|uniref:Type II toxin-antitoxin system RelE/ParE family toxin n=1 Tax=Microlunatus phosphovorus (strain ATCC 700054 / DSM 10555 / JCM 9379 / NBRC 101784 / NCIMB 13414 / VKM Ac-1990 / NM-1) TaxID=1032480 RepID=F5XG25_MICPN|nr:type II toxin-antitoxin system RelE/ParE family toxin [Microlunatus phosphovorus]BAK37959.1 hypothetical protein MLP_49450 [Microlunatus phosphovorus NM-1]